MKRYFYYFLFLFALGASFYYAYLALSAHEGYISLVLRGISTLLWFILAVLMLKERNITRKQRIATWLNKEKPKGFWYHLLYLGAIRWGTPVGYLIWVETVDFKKEQNLLISAGTHMIYYIIVGLLFGWYFWVINNKESQRLEFDNEKN